MRDNALCASAVALGIPLGKEYRIQPNTPVHCEPSREAQGDTQGSAPGRTRGNPKRGSGLCIIPQRGPRGTLRIRHQGDPPREAQGKVQTLNQEYFQRDPRRSRPSQIHDAPMDFDQRISSGTCGRISRHLLGIKMLPEILERFRQSQNRGDVLAGPPGSLNPQGSDP